MPETRAQRTLVKSPPELWSEISDAQTLARRLSAFGEVRITRMEPETAVAWEGAFVRGMVELEASGWGTKVTITAAPIEVAPAEPPQTSAEPEATGTDIPPQDTAPAPREGFLARLSGWWRTGRWAALPVEPQTALEPPEVEPTVIAEVPPAPEPERTGPAAEELEGLLVAVLDDLGSAHHRPFSRA